MKIVALDGHTLNPGDNSWETSPGSANFVATTAPARPDIERARDAAVIVTNKAPLPAATIARLPS